MKMGSRKETLDVRSKQLSLFVGENNIEEKEEKNNFLRSYLDFLPHAITVVGRSVAQDL